MGRESDLGTQGIRHGAYTSEKKNKCKDKKSDVANQTKRVLKNSSILRD